MSRPAQLNLDRAAFLADYWQRKPLCIPGAVTDFTPPISADELAGLALEDEVESRLIVQSGGQWHIEHGPFIPSAYTRPAPWTLLVQAVDHYVEEVAALRGLVDFLPAWRIDDVMVSYGNDGASVGPHYDNYDVFLLQGEGRKRWKLGQRCDADSARVAHDELRILRDFQQEDEFVLATGDILYVPPGIAHWGIALGESTTFSIGFRAPRINDLLSRWADAALERIDPELFFTDAGRTLWENGGELSGQDVADARRQILAALEACGDEGEWFGEVITEPRYELAAHGAAAAPDWRAAMSDGALLRLQAGAKLAWICRPQRVTVFANGQSTVCGSHLLSLLRKLWQSAALEAEDLNEEAAAALINFLLETGCVYVE